MRNANSGNFRLAVLSYSATNHLPERFPMRELHQIREALQDGEHYAGLIIGKDGKEDYHLLLLPGDAEEVSWAAAMQWAGQTGGELPTRRELSLLFANLREQFQRVWYWSCETQEPRSHLVWGQNFTSGIQTMYGRPFRGRARAVRRVPVQQSVPAAAQEAIQE
jgi:hypothetical protein